MNPETNCHLIDKKHVFTKARKYIVARDVQRAAIYHRAMCCGFARAVLGNDKPRVVG
jgi:hypothetical protein